MWILIPVLLVFVTSSVVVVVFATKLISAPIQATNDYYADLRAGHYLAAYNQMCDRRQRNLPYTDFRAQQSAAGGVDSYDFTGIDFPNADSIVDIIATGTVDRGGFTYDARVGLTREDDDWKVCSVQESP